MMFESNKPASPLQEPDDEATLMDVINFLQSGWKWLLGFTATGVLLGLVYIISMNPVYEASASIRMAKVANELVETPELLTEKMKLPMFYSESFISKCVSEGTAQPGLVLAAALKPTVNKAAPIVQFRFRDSSPQRASGCLSVLVSDIKAKQKKLAIPLINKINRQIAQLELRLTEIRKFSSYYQKVLPQSKSDGTSLIVSSPKLNAELNWFQETGVLQAGIDFLKGSLEPPDTQETELIYSIYAPDVKISPSRFSCGVAGGFGGMVFGFLFLLARNALRRTRP